MGELILKYETRERGGEEMSSELPTAMFEWKPIRARVSLISVPSLGLAAASAHSLYRHIWQDDPDSFQKANGPSPAVAQGKRQGGMSCNCLVYAARIDFNLVATPLQGPQMELALIRDPAVFDDGLKTIVRAISQGFDADFPVLRVAMYTQYLCPAPNFKEANQRLTEIMPDNYRVTLKEEQDFVLQMNEPYTSAVIPNSTLNALTKWSVERLQVIAFAMPQPAAQVPGQPIVPTANTRQFIAASMAFEHNLINPMQLSSTQQSSLLSEILSRIEQRKREKWKVGANNVS